MLRAEQLTKDYPAPSGPIRILENLNLVLDRGQSAAIMGPSGSGKSTLLYMLGALDRPTGGAVIVDGTDVGTLGDSEQASFRNRHVGFVFQDHALLPQCTVVENVLVPTLVAAGDGDAVHRAGVLLEAVGLGHRLAHRPGELSGGERQRVAIARALIMRPSLLLCDEPTGNLDRESASTVADLLLRLHAESNSVLVVVTHSAELAGRFAVRYQLRNRGLERV